MLSSPKSPQWGLVSIIAARNAHTGLVGRRLPGRRGASAEGRRSASAARHPSCPGETLSPPPQHIFRTFSGSQTHGDAGTGAQHAGTTEYELISAAMRTAWAPTGAMRRGWTS